LFPVVWGAEQVEVFVGPYGDDAAYRDLEEAREGWSCWRDRYDGSRVYIWRHDESAAFARNGFRLASVARSDNPALFCRIMLEGIDRHLSGLGFVQIGRRGYANWAVGNLLSRIQVTGFVPDPRVGIFPKIEIDSFLTGSGNEHPVIGLVVDIVYTSRLDIPVSELVSSGFDVRGRYVKLRPGVGDSPLQGFVVGRVVQVEQRNLVLEDRREQVSERIDPELCVLEASRRTLQDYLLQVHPEHYRFVIGALERVFKEFISPKKKLHFIEEFARRRLIGSDGRNIQVAAGLELSLGAALSPNAETAIFRVRELLSPTYSFDPESSKTHSTADGGLKLHGPYSRARLAGKSINIMVLAPDGYKGQVGQFVEQFKSGVRGFESTYGGFAKKYRLEQLQITPKYFPWLSGSAKDAYYNATVKLLEESNDFDLCFIVIREDFRTLPNADNPYYVCKALLLSFGITVQDVRIETLRAPDESLQWTLNTVALATYAKLGGSPFVLKARQLGRHELVFGIGHSVQRPPGSRLGRQEQVIGFTTVFRSDGDYLLNACTPYTDIANYERRLEAVILKSVEEVADIEGIDDGGELRLIFHVYKTTGQREVRAIQNAIAKLTRFQVEFALLHVNDSHNFKLFDRTNQGRPWKGQADFGALVAPRRVMIEIGPRERLINFVGPQQYRGRGTPMPVRLTLDRSSTFRDLDYLAQQAYEFSFMSWRSFNPGHQPVTVFYSELMAGLNNRLRQVAPWNEELVRTKLRRKLWFT